MLSPLLTLENNKIHKKKTFFPTPNKNNNKNNYIHTSMTQKDLRIDIIIVFMSFKFLSMNLMLWDEGRECCINSLDVCYELF